LELPAFLSAAERGEVNALQMGLASGIGVDDADPGGWTALLTATRMGQLEVVRFLLGVGADPTVERTGGFGPLHMLIEGARSGLQPDHLGIVNALLGAGADPNQRTRKGGQTPVRNAAAVGLIPVLRSLLVAGGEVDLRDKDQATPLFVAADRGAEEAVRVLLEAGADPNLADRYGRTPLHAAALVGSLVVCRVLIEAGADPMVGTRFPVGRLRAKSTAQQAAERMGHTDVAELLQSATCASVGEAPWPDADSAEAEWVGRVLLGKQDFPTHHDDRHVLDALFRAWSSGEEQRRLRIGFRGLLTHPSSRLRSAAVHFYVKFLVPDGGVVRRAWAESPALYRGVRSEWYPEETDLAGLLRTALSRY